MSDSAPPQQMPDRVPVPKKVKNESYEAKQARISAMNYNFMKMVEPRVAEWSKKHPGQNPPIVKDKDGILYWLNRKQRKAQLAKKK